MKILTILSDSLAMVRFNDKISEKTLYPYKIQKKLGGKIYVSNKASRNNSSEVENQNLAYWEHIVAADSAFFIIGLGIVDCSPRLFNKQEKEILNCLTKIPLIGKLFRGYIRYKSWNRYKITKKRQITDTSHEDYKNNMVAIIEKIKKTTPVEHIFLLNIAYPGPYMATRSYKIEDNIIEFNEILAEITRKYDPLVTLIDVYGITKANPAYILPDGHHISAEVHDYIANEVSSKLIKML